MPSFKTLRGKLATSYLILALVPLILFGIWIYSKALDLIADHRAESLEQEARQLGSTVDRFLYERYGDALTFSKNPLLLGSAQDIQAVADSYAEGYAVSDLVLVASLDGKVEGVNSVNADGKPVNTQEFIGKSVKGQDWFEAVASGKVGKGQAFYGDIFKDEWIAQASGNNGLAMIFSAPIFDAQGKLVRVWAANISSFRGIGNITNEYRAVAQEQGILGVEVMLFNKAGIVIDDTELEHVLHENLLSKGSPEAIAVTAGAFGNKMFFDADPEYNQNVIAGYAPCDGEGAFKGLGWGITIRQKAADTLAGADTLVTQGMIAILLAAGVILGASFLLSKSISGPVQKAANVLEAVSKGDLSQRLETKSQDEIGRMAKALNQATESMKKNLDDIQANAERERAMTAQLKNVLTKISENANSLAHASTDLSTVSDKMSQSASQASDQSTMVSSAAEEVSSSVGTVANSVEQMNVSIKDISKNAHDALKVASSAVQMAERTTANVQKLGESSTEIGKVIKVINSIAEQTNLLALNATIEAARAGDAGKGFAVVANEVKELAKETAKATEDIAKKIEAIQSDTTVAVNAIVQISSIINQINDYQNTIASAVEEQTATTSEIGRSISEAAKGTADIAKNITGIAQVVEETNAGVAGIQRSSGELAQMASALQRLVSELDKKPRQEVSGVFAPLKPVTASFLSRPQTNGRTNGHTNGYSTRH